jgi:acyl-coenzyme A thioesterase PaaI-like protein
MDIHDFLGARRSAPGDWTFSLPQRMHGAFGGAFGGLVAACAILASRDAAPDRTPAAGDFRFLRGLRAGDAHARATLVRAGRSLSCVQTDILDGDGELSARAVISFVDAGALRDIPRDAVQRPPDWTPFDEAEPWPPVAPIVETLRARTVGSGPDGVATAVHVPWEPAGDAEAACLAADMSVGPPVAYAVSGERVSTPNPDLSVRFCGEVSTRVVVGLARTERVHGGVAAVRIAVWSGDSLAAIGVSSSLVLG